MNSIKRGLIYYVLSLFGLLAASCNLPTQGTGLHAWIDSPLNGSLLPVDSEVDVISHSNDLAGITNVELSINNVVLRTDAVPNPGEVYVLMSQAWTPTQAGSYLVKVRSQNANGVWSDYGVVSVKVESGPRINLTLGESPTPVATFTPNPTATPSQIPTPENPTFTLNENASCRSGPDVSFTELASIPDGVTVDIKGASEDGSWYFIFWKQFSVRCWAASTAGVTAGNMTGVPVMISPPTPLPTSRRP